MTRTYAIMEVSPETHAEIKAKLVQAEYSHAIDGEVLDMYGISLEPGPERPRRCETCRWWERAENEDRRGRCHRTEVPGRLFSIGLKDPNAESALLTSFDFGCVQWEAKP